MENRMFTQHHMIELLDKLFDISKKGVEIVSPPLRLLVDDYLSKENTVEAAAKSFINYQIAKCTTAGFLTNIGGIITLPIAIPANIGSVLYVQMRMIAGLALMGGFDIESDQVQALVYACLAMISLNAFVKHAAVKFGNKLTMTLVAKIPGKVLTKINQQVGFRFLTKFGSKGLINICKIVPLVGGFIGGGFDFVETKLIGDRAYKMFIKGEFDLHGGDEIVEDEIIINEEDFISMD